MYDESLTTRRDFFLHIRILQSAPRSIARTRTSLGFGTLAKCRRHCACYCPLQAYLSTSVPHLFHHAVVILFLWDVPRPFRLEPREG